VGRLPGKKRNPDKNGGHPDSIRKTGGVYNYLKKLGSAKNTNHKKDEEKDGMKKGGI